MARGWESKSVESQMESARDEGMSGRGGPRSHEDKEVEREKQTLLLSRVDVQHRIDSASNPGYVESLRKALEEIDHKLADLDARR